MNPPDHAWSRLAAAARRAPDRRDDTAPHGFATRVAALGLAARPVVLTRTLLERFALRGFLTAGVFSLAAVAYGFTVLTPPADADAPLDDIVSEFLADS